MAYRIAADAVLVLHLGFILFVLLGALLSLRWPWAWRLHLPAAFWGAWVELSGGACPLTAWENLLRVRAGLDGYEDSFVAHYLLALIYPAGLTRPLQHVLAGVVVFVNGTLYAWVLRRRRGRR